MDAVEDRSRSNTRGACERPGGVGNARGEPTKEGVRARDVVVEAGERALKGSVTRDRESADDEIMEARVFVQRAVESRRESERKRQLEV